MSSEAGATSKFLITDDLNFGIEWTVTSSGSGTPAWLQVATDAQGTGAAATQTAIGDSTLYAYALTANPSKEESRTATTYEIAFTKQQAPPAMPQSYRTGD